MALIKCSKCGKEISDKAAACPGCGCPVEVVSEVPVSYEVAEEAQPSVLLPEKKTDSFKIVRIIIGCVCGLILGVSFAVAKGGGLFIVILLTGMAGVVASLDFGGFSLAVLGAVIGVIVLGVWLFLKVAMSM